MPYCPKCDMEFIDGITVCTDCGGPLVESEEAARAMRAAEKEQKLARERAMYEALKQKAEEEWKDDSSGSEEETASDEQRDFDISDLTAEDGELDVDKLTPEEAQALLNAQEPPKRERNYVYVDKSQKYNDLKSSASAFLIVGCALAVVSVLLWTGIIRLPMATVSRMIFQGALTLMAVFSLVVYFNTSRDAQKLAPQIAQEKERTQELIQWFMNQYSAEDIDREIPEMDSLSGEELSLKRFQLIQDYLITGQDLPDPAYVDALCEEIYEKIFEK